MARNSDIFVYDIYSMEPVPVKKILRILKPILINYKMRDKKFMWVNLLWPIPSDYRLDIISLNDDIYCQRASLDRPRAIVIPSPKCVGCRTCNPKKN